MGFTREGKITGLRCRIVGDGGAYGGFGGMLPAATTRMMATGTYHVPKIAYEVAVALTNTTPMGAYRGAGRPEAAAFLERIMEMASVELGIDPLELRRRNFLQPDDFPFVTLTGADYDCGDYELRARRGGPGRRLRRAARRAGRAACSRRPDAAGHRRRVVRRGHRRRDRHRVRLRRGARRRQRDRARRHVVARAGPRDVVRDDRVRQARHPARPDPRTSSPTPH